MKTIAAVITCVDSGPLAEEALHYLKENSDPEITTLILVDNGSYTPLPRYDADLCIRYEQNIGANAVFHRIILFLRDLEVDIVAYFHCDLMVRESKWDHKLLAIFNDDPLLGLVGFVGSSEIDGSGGRGRGTISSFIGAEYETGYASPASAHGYVATGVHPAAVLDHASMIFPVKILKELPPQEGTYTPGHFYDRILSCELLDRDYHLAVVDIKCDHFSGGTGLCKAPGEHLGVVNRNEFYTKWLKENNISWIGDNPDLEVYKIGEKIFLDKWLREKRFIPLSVDSNYNIKHHTWSVLGDPIGR